MTDEPINPDILSDLQAKENPAEAIRWALADRSVIASLAAQEMADFQLACLNLRDRGAKAVEIERLERAVGERRRELRREVREYQPPEPAHLSPLEEAASIVDEADGRIENLAATLDALVTYYGRFTVFTRIEQAWACALWAAHTFVIEYVRYTPRLAILAPTKRCGKSNLLELLSLTAYNVPGVEVLTSPSGVFRGLDEERMTILIDEVDTLFGPQASGHEELRSIINHGYKANGIVRRSVPHKEKGWVTKKFPAFCAMALTGIGKLPDTVEDRSIPIKLERAPNSTFIEDLEEASELEGIELGGLLAAWAKRHGDRVKSLTVERIMEINGRARNIWSPLQRVALLAGGEWPERCRQAAVVLSGRHGEEIDETDQAAVLDAVRRIFRAKGYPPLLKSAEVVDALNALEEESWSSWHRGNGFKSYDLRRLLGAFDLRSRKGRLGEHTPWGFWLEDLRPVWDRYLPELDLTDSGSEPYPPESSGRVPVTRPAHRHTAGQSMFLTEAESNGNGSKSASDQHCSGVPVVPPEHEEIFPGGVFDDDGEWS